MRKCKARRIHGTQDALPLLGGVPFGARWIEAACMTEIAGDDQDIASREGTAKVLGLEMQIAEVVAAQGGDPWRIATVVSMGERDKSVG
jgi:hypothetical protein